MAYFMKEDEGKWWKENKKKEDGYLKTLYSSDEHLFNLVIDCVMGKFYMDSLEDQMLNAIRWIDILRWTLWRSLEM